VSGNEVEVLVKKNFEPPFFIHNNFAKAGNSALLVSLFQKFKLSFLAE